MQCNKNGKITGSLAALIYSIFFVFICAEVHAGTGYIDSDGKWRFTVAFYHEANMPPADIADIQTEWLNIFSIADRMLYRATGERHQFGNVKYYTAQSYDPTVDVIIGLERTDDPRADVYGINRLGYHIFFSEQWRRDQRNAGKTDEDIARVLIHELGHYLYELFDEYRGETDATSVIECIPDGIDFPIDLSDKACFMEQSASFHQTWCYDENHDIEPGDANSYDTWQSKANDDQACWDIMTRLYETEAFATASFSPEDPEPIDVSGVTMMQTLVTAHIELLVAVDKEIYDNPDHRLKMDQMLTRTFASFPAGTVTGRVAFMMYSGNDMQTPTTAPTFLWDNTLHTSYTTFLDEAHTGLPSSTDPPNLTGLIEFATEMFAQISIEGGFDPNIGGTPRTFLLLTLGNGSPGALDVGARTNFQAQNVRTTIGFFQQTSLVSPVYFTFADAINASYYDTNSPEVLAYQAVDVANKQALKFTSAALNAGQQHSFFFSPPGDLEASIVSVTWNVAGCNLPVAITHNGQGGEVEENSQSDFVGPGIKGRRLFKLFAGDSVVVSIPNVPANCQATPFLVTCTISDEQPMHFLTAAPERFILGSNDVHNVHARVISRSYPVRNLDMFAGAVDTLGNYIAQAPRQLRDQGFLEQCGDWVANDGIYSQNDAVAFSAPGFHTVKFTAENRGSAEFVVGESLLDSLQSGFDNEVGNFRREGFATYYVDPSFKTTLPVGMNNLRVEKLGTSGDSVTIAINADKILPPDYPHARSVRATWGNTSLRVVGNGISDTLVVHKSKSAPVELRVLFRTTDLKIARSSVITALDARTEESNRAPEDFRLFPNYPNPFNAGTRIAYSLPKAEKISLVIYDLTGRKVRTLFEQKKIQAGRHEISWDGLTDQNTHAGSGIYMIRLSGNGFIFTRKAILLK